MCIRDANDEPNLGLITLVCSWTFTPLATIAIGLMLWSHHLTRIPLRIEDYMLISAFFTTVVLVVQITWAIVDEGQDKHIIQVSRTRLALIARVCSTNMV